MKCNWNDGNLCPFGDLESTVELFEGRAYCRAHLPAAANGKNSVEWVQKFIAEREAKSQHDFRGLVFVAAPKGQATYVMSTGDYDCRNADVQDQVVLETSKANKANFSGSNFHGRNHLRGRWKVLEARDCNFEGEVHCRFESGTGSIDFAGSRFGSKAKLQNVSGLTQLCLDDCEFHRAPSVLDEKIPQQTTFNRAKFRPTALGRQDEGKYRHIRNLFNQNRARESEGQFYALEKRAHRKSLPWRSAWFARSVSWTYDVTSAYGQSYERAFLAFVLAQLCFGLAYNIAAGRFELGGPIDAEAVSFTLSQVAKPFELLSARDPSAAAYKAIVGEGGYSTGWTFWTFVHSVLSLTLAALFLLAVRWRFRRE